jgi:hypothetical protein
MLPKSRIGRFVAVIWLLACASLLVFAFKQRHVHDMPEAFTWLLIFLTFPIGFVGATVVGLLWGGISSILGLTYHPFADLIPIWVIVVSLGYWQWFVALPWLVRKIHRPKLGA